MFTKQGLFGSKSSVISPVLLVYVDDVLQLRSWTYDQSFLKFKSDRVTWYRPTSLADLLSLKAQHPDGRLVVGNTAFGSSSFVNPLALCT